MSNLHLNVHSIVQRDINFKNSILRVLICIFWLGCKKVKYSGNCSLAFWQGGWPVDVMDA